MYTNKASFKNTKISAAWVVHKIVVKSSHKIFEESNTNKEI